MSRNEGSGGASRIASVISASARSEPSVSSPVRSISRVRRSHSVCIQISPSECTSGAPATLPKSPNV